MPAMLLWLHQYHLVDGGGDGRHCVLWKYISHESMDVPGYEDLPWILHVIFTLKRVSTVRRARKIAVTMVSMDGDQEGRPGTSAVSLVALSLRGP